jgi:hypothetical protein
MEPEVWLPRSQEPSTTLYPEPDQSSPHQPILCLKSILILSTHLRLGFPTGLFPSGFPTNVLYAFIYPHSCYKLCPWYSNSRTSCDDMSYVINHRREGKESDR